MMKQSEDKKIEKLQTMIFTGILVAVFVLLICLVWPDGCFYGSTTDWYNQHVTLAETIRNVCMQERTLGAVLDFPRRRKQWISVCLLWAITARILS